VSRRRPGSSGQVTPRTLEAAQIHAALPRIIAYWRDWLRHSPGEDPRTGQRGRREQVLVAALIDTAFAAPDDRSALRSLELAASAYGASPRRTRLDPTELSDELGLLRHAIWRCVQETHPEDPERLRFVMRLDHAVSIAVQATLRGGYGGADQARDSSPAREMK
jgi:hypothetical protein